MRSEQGGTNDEDEVEEGNRVLIIEFGDEGPQVQLGASRRLLDVAGADRPTGLGVALQLTGARYV